VAVDVCKALGLENATKAVGRLAPDQTTLISIQGSPDVNAVSESGLYMLVLRSRKPAAVPFQDWVTREVIPTIRRTGVYSLAVSPMEPVYKLGRPGSYCMGTLGSYSIPLTVQEFLDLHGMPYQLGDGPGSLVAIERSIRAFVSTIGYGPDCGPHPTRLVWVYRIDVLEAWIRRLEPRPQPPKTLV
jgi:hypothetical protein